MLISTLYYLFFKTVSRCASSSLLLLLIADPQVLLLRLAPRLVNNLLL